MGVGFLALRDWLACLWEFAVLNCYSRLYVEGRVGTIWSQKSAARISGFLCCSFEEELLFLLESLVFSVKAQGIE